MVEPTHIVDYTTFKVGKVLLENPSIPYTKTSLSETAGISRDALNRRWNTYKEIGLIEQAEVGSDSEYWQLNSDSEIANLLGEILYKVFDEAEEDLRVKPSE